MAKEPNKQTPKIEPDPNREQEIRRRTYSLYKSRGHDVDDWLRAEAEVSPIGQKAAA